MEPSRVQPPPRAPLSTPPETEHPEAPPNVEDALASIERLQAERRARPMAMCILGYGSSPAHAKGAGGPNPPLSAFAMDDLAVAYANGGGVGLAQYLDANPEMLRELAIRRPDELEHALFAAFARTGVFSSPAGAHDAIVGELATRIRGRVLRDAQARVEHGVTAAQALRDALPERLAALRQAAPGSDDARLAEMLGIRGDAGDLERANARIDSTIDMLRRFAEFAWSPTRWSNADFPFAALRAAETLGFPTPPPGSIGEEAVADGGCTLAVREAIDEGRSDVQDVGSLVTSFVRSPLGPAVQTALELGLAIHHVALGEHRGFVRVGHGLGL